MTLMRFIYMPMLAKLDFLLNKLPVFRKQNKDLYT